MRGFALRFRIVPGERISPNAIVWSSRTANVPFGDTFGVPSRDAVATNPRRCSSIILFMSGVSMSGSSKIPRDPSDSSSCEPSRTCAQPTIKFGLGCAISAGLICARSTAQCCSAVGLPKGHSRLGRASRESSHVRCAAESGSKFRTLAALPPGVAG
jgi:hypothetical protein